MGCTGDTYVAHGFYYTYCSTGYSYFYGGCCEHGWTVFWWTFFCVLIVMSMLAGCARRRR